MEIHLSLTNNLHAIYELARLCPRESGARSNDPHIRDQLIMLFCGDHTACAACVAAQASKASGKADPAFDWPRFSFQRRAG